MAGADYYALAISESPYGTSHIVHNPQRITGTSYGIPSAVLKSGTKYRWNVQAHAPAGFSDVSVALYFQFGTSPQVISPRPPAISTSTPVVPATAVGPSPWMSGDKIAKAIQWAKDRQGKTYTKDQTSDKGDSYYYSCLAFVARAYTRTDTPVQSYASASVAATQLNARENQQATPPPRGAWVFYAWATDGHAALSLGDGTVIHCLTKTAMAKAEVLVNGYDQIGGATYVGWAWPKPEQAASPETPTQAAPIGPPSVSPQKLISPAQPNAQESIANPSPPEINGEIERLALEYNVPPIIVQAICWNENRWVHIDPATGRPAEGLSGDFGLMQVTEQEAATFPQYADWKDNWRTNLRLSVRLLVERKWAKNEVPEPVGKLILENWYYPVAWYNGYGPTAYDYVGRAYAFMRNPPSEIAMFAFCRRVDVGSPRLIPGWETDKNIKQSGNKPYQIKELVQAGERIHQWNGKIGTDLAYVDITERYAAGVPETAGASPVTRADAKSPPTEAAKRRVRLWGIGRSTNATAKQQSPTGTESNLEPRPSELTSAEKKAAAKLWARAEAAKKNVNAPLVGEINKRRMVDLCRQIMRQYPDSEYAAKARQALAGLPEKDRRRYSVTDQEIGTQKK